MSTPAGTLLLLSLVAPHGARAFVPVFEVNRGQADAGVRFVSRGRGYTLLVGDREAVWRGRWELRVRMAGASGPRSVEGVGPLAGRSHYLLGDDLTKWRTEIPHYRGVRWVDVYPGIDAVFYGHADGIEYDVVVKPGADPRAVALEFGGVERAEVNRQGDLVLRTGRGEHVQRRPRIYQERDGRRIEIGGGYVPLGKERVGFRVGAYDRRCGLVIDPVLVYSTYLGVDGFGDGTDEAQAVAMDAAGNAYVTGATDSLSGFGSPGAFQSRKLDQSGVDAFVTKLAPDGRVVYTTYFGGNGTDVATGIAVDGQGNAHITGWTSSNRFPVSSEAYQPVRSGESLDAFVMKLGPQGSGIVYSTYVGGNGVDYGMGIAVDGEGNAYVAGMTESTNFPTTAGAPATSYRGGDFDAFVFKLNPAGTRLVYSTYLGGKDLDAAFAIAVDATGAAYAGGDTYSRDFPATPGALRTTAGAGFDGWVAKLSSAGALAWSTLLGGTRDNRVTSVAVGASGEVAAGGWTTSPDFPVTAGALRTALGGQRNGFVAKLNAAGSALSCATYLGGSKSDTVNRVALDTVGNIYVAGQTASSDFPVTASALGREFGGGPADGFVAVLSAAGTGLLYASYLGGSGDDRSMGLATDGKGAVVVSGATTSRNFPVTPGARQTAAGSPQDGFFARLDLAQDLRTLSVSPDRLDFRAAAGTSPAAQTVTITALPGIQPGWSVETRTASGGNWLSVSPARGAGPASVQVTVRSDALAAGAYAATLAVRNESIGTQSEIAVTLVLMGQLSANGVVNAATFRPGPVAPGEIVTVFGPGIGPPALAGAKLDADGRLATVSGGTRVFFDGVAAPMVYASGMQVSAVARYAVAGKASATMQVEYLSLRSNVVTLPVAAASPGIFTADSSGRGQGSILNQDTSPNSPSNPAARGSIVAIYATGEGQTNPPGVDGKLAEQSFPKPLLPVTVQIGGAEAEVVYAGAAPGLVAGLLQVNARVPATVAPGSAVPVVITVGTTSSPAGVTLAVR